MYTAIFVYNIFNHNDVDVCTKKCYREHWTLEIVIRLFCFVVVVFVVVVVVVVLIVVVVVLNVDVVF